MPVPPKGSVMRVRKKKYLVLSLLFIFFFVALLLGIIGLPKLEVAAETQEKPILWSISDAVKKNEAITLQGHYLYEKDNTKVIMAKNTGKEPTVMPSEYEEITQFLSQDEDGEGLIFKFPNHLESGCYDIWVVTSYGTSNPITLNCARPLYIDQEASYAGLPIQIVGRNFLQYEFGVGDLDSSLRNVKVKLVSTTNAELEYNAVVKTEESFPDWLSASGQAIDETNPYRITFTTPDAEPGIYKVLVSNDGKDFRGLYYPQTLEIKEKKAQNWNTTVFGTEYLSHIGNDPLDLQVYWAQDLNYTNVVTMTPFASEPTKHSVEQCANDIAEVQTFTTSVVNAIKDLKNRGGGVVYFPEGNYYLGDISDKDYIAENVLFVGAGQDKTKIYYAGANRSTWIRSYASKVGFARMTMEQWDISDSTKKPDNVLALFDIGGTDKMIETQTTKNKFIVDMKFRFSLEPSTGGENRRCYNTVSGQKNFVYRNIDWEGGQTTLSCNVYQYAKLENIVAKFDGGNSNLQCNTKYATLENISIEAMQTNGHGYVCKAGVYVGNCSVKNVGVIGENASNKGEAIMFEPASGYFSTGTLASATARTFTTNLLAGNEVDMNTQLLYNQFAIYIVGGTGAGQMRIFNRPTNAIESGSTSNVYSLAENEKDWDVIPDNTSKYTITCPLEGNTVYRLKAEHCLKGIYLYANCFDTVVAECETIDTEGIYVDGTSCAENGRTLGNANIRIVNNSVKGVSPCTGKGGIVTRLNSWGDNLNFGTPMRNITIRGNVLTHTVKASGTTYYSAKSEMSDMRGIAIVSTRSSGIASKVDYKLVVIESNTVNNSENGIYVGAYADGVVIQYNNIENTSRKAVDIDASRATNVYNLEQATITYILNGGTNATSNPKTYSEGIAVSLADATKDGYTFKGWYTDEYFTNQITEIPATQKGAVTLYARFVKIPVTRNITYVLDGGVNSTSNPLTYVEGSVFTFFSATKEGYTFEGWYEESSFTNKVTEISVRQTGDITLYAKFVKNAEEPPVSSEQPELPSDSSGETNSSTESATDPETSVDTNSSDTETRPPDSSTNQSQNSNETPLGGCFGSVSNFSLVGIVLLMTGLIVFRKKQKEK